MGEEVTFDIFEGYCLKHVPWARRKKAFERVGRKRLSVSEGQGQGLDKCLIATRAWWVVSTSWEGPWRLTPPSYSHPRGRDRSHPRGREWSQPMGRERSNYTSSEGGLEVNTSFKFSSKKEMLSLWMPTSDWRNDSLGFQRKTSELNLSCFYFLFIRTWIYKRRSPLPSPYTAGKWTKTWCSCPRRD